MNTHPNDQKKVNCWDCLMIRTDAVSTLKVQLRRASTNREGFYNIPVFTLGEVCAENSRISGQRRSDWRGGQWGRRGQQGVPGAWGRECRAVGTHGQEFLSTKLKVQGNNTEKGGRLHPGQHTCNPSPALSPTTSWFSITPTHLWLWTVEFCFIVQLCDFKGKCRKR